MRIALSTRSTLLRRPRALPYPFNSAYTENIKQNAWAVDQGPDSWYAVPAVPRSKSRHGRPPTDGPAIVLPSVLTRCDDSTSIRAEKLLCQDRVNRLSAQFWRESAPSEGPISRAGACRPACAVLCPSSKRRQESVMRAGPIHLCGRPIAPGPGLMAGGFRPQGR